MREPVVVLNFAMHRKDPDETCGDTCACKDKPVNITYKTGIVIWLKETGEQVKKGEVICEAEVEKATFEMNAPCDGILLEKRFQDNEEFKYGDVLGYIGEPG